MRDPAATGAVRPGWDWSEFSEAEWEAELADLTEWVSWLEQAFRVVQLPPCWALHWGLREELAVLWLWWLRLHASTPREELPAAMEMVGWYDALRRGAASWKEHYRGCTHEGRDQDEVKKPRAASLEQASRYKETALQLRARLDP